ncbi:protein phosphatase 1L [Lates japonicus]|uniref:Protein phosphatase 1L n=1 Tax=Lates japonicus TaxID=270547 RepID=A0AAD3R764_LATJO|nr:protein phosphatase 1L [Lates japonicus]
MSVNGGFISFNGSWRVQGILAMSRSLGDYPLKNLNVVVPDPDIMSFDLNKLQERGSGRKNVRKNEGRTREGETQRCCE